MGTIETHIDLEKDVTIHTASGEISVEDIERRIRSYYESDVTRLLLWDLTNADVRGITASDVSKLVELTNAYISRRAGGKTALVFSSAHAYGMGRMYDLSKEADDELVEHASFHDLSTALEWLGLAADD